MSEQRIPPADQDAGQAADQDAGQTTEQAATAWSFGDGRFTYTAPMAQAPTVGTPVVLTPPDGRQLLGQVTRTVLANSRSRGRRPPRGARCKSSERVR